MKIAIFGGSFNPVHKGHISVANYAIEHLGLDKLIFVPAFKSPFKSKIKYTSGEDRINMLNIVKPEKSEVSSFEINRKSTSYTIDTLEYFKQKYPNDELFFLIGSDNVYKLNKWKKINEIVDIAQLVVFKREGDFSKINIKRYNAILMDNPLFDFASTWFRKGYLDNVEVDVMKYISSNYLYIPDLMSNMLRSDHKRHKHSQAVGSMAATMAKSLGQDAKKAWAIGCLHDITKAWTIEQHRTFLDELEVDHSEINDYELHSVTGYYWVKEKYKLDDDEFLNAILYHTSLNEELTLMDKIIYSADKLCEGRKHPGIQEDRKKILTDFEEGFRSNVARIYGWLKEDAVAEDRPLSKRQEDIYERWS